MMIWLYTCAIILVTGNVFNVSLSRAREIGDVPDEGSFSIGQLGDVISALIFGESRHGDHSKECKEVGESTDVEE